jgi:hypothetical protein
MLACKQGHTAQQRTLIAHTDACFQISFQEGILQLPIVVAASLCAVHGVKQYLHLHASPWTDSRPEEQSTAWGLVPSYTGMRQAWEGIAQSTTQ